MAKSQPTPLNPPIPADRSMLIDFTSSLQNNLVALFQAAHDHSVLSANPSGTSGAVQQISIVDTGSSVYLVVKTSRGWFKSPAFTAI